jgi:choline dehydrogenase-like flavoprotein
MAYLQLQRVVRREVATELRHWARLIWDKGQMIDTWRSARAAQMRDPAASDMRRGQVLSLYVRAEQAPNPSSRVSLSERKDALGVPQPRLDWRLQDADTWSILAWLAELDSEMRSRALAHVIKMREDLEDRIVGGAHHMGTTRMSGDPKTGVVDAQCRVHSVENLYIAGSSVFSTSGWSNPTFTIVALALRLADELRRSLTWDNSVDTRPVDGRPSVP